MHYQWQGKNLLLSCHLQPKAAKDEIVGLQGDSLKIRITAPPIDGRANAHLIKFLAKTLCITKREISILSGELGRQKRIKVEQPTKIPDILQIDPESRP